jgi:hypothetical protein
LVGSLRTLIGYTPGMSEPLYWPETMDAAYGMATVLFRCPRLHTMRPVVVSAVADACPAIPCSACGDLMEHTAPLPERKPMIRVVSLE